MLIDGDHTLLRKAGDGPTLRLLSRVPESVNPPGHTVGRRKVPDTFDGGGVGEVVAAGACQHRVINQGERAVGKQVEQHSAGKRGRKAERGMGVQRT